MGLVTTKTLTVAVTDTLIAATSNSRGYVGIQNLDSADNLFVTFGGAAATIITGIQIKAGEYLEVKAPGMGSEIRGISDSGNILITVLSD